MKKIGITGSFCSGIDKINEICSFYEYPVFEADIAIKFLLNWREDVIEKVRKKFGKTISASEYLIPYQFTGVNRFNDLLDIIEDDIFLMWDNFVKKNKKNDLVFFKSNIIFEREWKFRFEKVIFIYKPFSKRAGEIIRKKELTWADAFKMKEEEMSDQEKIDKSDYIINNHDNLSILTQFDSIKERIINMPATKKNYLM